MTRTETIAFRVVLLVALAVITYLATTRPDYPIISDISDKLNHLMAFYALAFLFDFSFPEREMGFAKIIVLLAYGLWIEVVQSFLPERTASVLDLCADGIGIAIYRFSLPLLRQLPWLSRRWSQRRESSGHVCS
jgi:VanZ family protein